MKQSCLWMWNLSYHSGFFLFHLFYQPVSLWSKYTVFCYWASVATSYLFYHFRGLAKAFILKVPFSIKSTYEDLVQQSLPTWFWKWPNSQITIVVYGTAEQLSRVVPFNTQTSSLTVHRGFPNSLKIIFERYCLRKHLWSGNRMRSEEKLWRK